MQLWGFGINTQQEKFNKEISKIASSINQEFAIKVEREKVIAEFCNLFERKIKRRKGEFV